jgi:hypothetical protein
MFEWLEEEIASIKTRKFHLVDGPLRPEKRELVRSSELAVPPSYKEFVIRFGNAKLYRRSSYWLVEVYAGPLERVTNEEPLLEFGRTHTSLAYFKESLLVAGCESPVFEWRHEQGVQQTADSFLDWLKAKCSEARKEYKKKEWEAIVKGPPPFSSEEKAIVEARRKYRWEKVGIAENGDIQFEVFNGSNTVLPYLTIGIRGKLRPPKTGPLTGGAFLPVSCILPGQSQIIEFDCYKKYVDPKDVEAFAQPEPQPEDRDEYWEFKRLK